MSFYNFARNVCSVFLKIYFKLHVKGADNVPPSGEGIILVSNHQSNLDPVILGLGVKNRKLFFMAKQELFKVPILSPIIKKLGAFPVNRGSKDLDAIKKAEEIVNSGRILAMFPEGGRSKTGKLLRPKVGATKIAISTGKNLLPCSICYSSKRFRSNVYVEYGKPVSVEKIMNSLNITNDELNSKNLKMIAEKSWEKVSEIYNLQREEI